MFHRLTLFDLSKVGKIAAIDKVMATADVPLQQNQQSTHANYTLQQWRWNSPTEEGTMQRVKKHETKYTLLLESIQEILSKQPTVDYVLQSSQQPIENIKLAVFDMDSTLIQAEVMDELAYAMGIGPQVALITARSMAGELDFEQSFRQRLALLKGFTTNQLATINQSLELMPGALQLMQGLQERGVYCAILSGGFSYFADRLALRLGMQEAFSNPLEEVEGKLTGQVTGPVLDASSKVHLMHQLQKSLGLSIHQCLAVGDGANDLPMLNAAGLGVAFHGKPLVRQQAPHQLNQVDLGALLHLV